MNEGMNERSSGTAWKHNDIVFTDNVEWQRDKDFKSKYG